MRILHRVRTWSRMTIWGDRVSRTPDTHCFCLTRCLLQLFLQFDGPATILVQSRGPRLNDVLSGREVNEIADTPRGVTSPARQSPKSERKEAEEAVKSVPEISRSVEDLTQEIKGISQSVAKIRKDGKVEIEEVGRTKEV